MKYIVTNIIMQLFNVFYNYSCAEELRMDNSIKEMLYRREFLVIVNGIESVFPIHLSKLSFKYETLTVGQLINLTYDELHSTKRITTKETNKNDIKYIEAILINTLDVSQGPIATLLQRNRQQYELQTITSDLDLAINE